MSRITFTDDERELMRPLFVRPFHILRKMAALAGSGGAREQVSVRLEDFIGFDFDERDVERIVNLVSGMRGIVSGLSVSDDALHMDFYPEALSLVKKLALQAEEDEPGEGVLYCESALALKRAFGMRGDVEYTQDFDFEDFNHGEDISYLDGGFEGDSWLMEIRGSVRGLNRMIQIMPDNGRISIRQHVSYGHPGIDTSVCDELADINREDFISPDFRKDFIPVIVEKRDACLERAPGKLAAC